MFATAVLMLSRNLFHVLGKDSFLLHHSTLLFGGSNLRWSRLPKTANTSLGLHALPSLREPFFSHFIPLLSHRTFTRRFHSHSLHTSPVRYSSVIPSLG